MSGRCVVDVFLRYGTSFLLRLIVLCERTNFRAHWRDDFCHGDSRDIAASVLVHIAGRVGADEFDSRVQTPFKKLDANGHRMTDFTGLSSETFRSNFYPHYQMLPIALCFRDIFGILYPAVTGMQSGANMSGDLLEFVFCIATLNYFTHQPVKIDSGGHLDGHCSQLSGLCRDDYAVCRHHLPPHSTHQHRLHGRRLVPSLFCFDWQLRFLLAATHHPQFTHSAATLSCAVSNLIGGAKILQALAQDNLIPGLSVFAEKHEPIRATLFSLLLVQLMLLFGDLNAIGTILVYLSTCLCACFQAPFVTLFFLLSDAGINLACFASIVTSTPNFRPSFRFYSRCDAPLQLTAPSIRLFEDIRVVWACCFVSQVSGRMRSFSICKLFSITADCYACYFRNVIRITRLCWRHHCPHHGLLRLHLLLRSNLQHLLN